MLREEQKSSLNLPKQANLYVLELTYTDLHELAPVQIQPTCKHTYGIWNATFEFRWYSQKQLRLKKLR